MPRVAPRSRRARRRGSPDDAPHDAAAVQRRSGVRREGRWGAMAAWQDSAGRAVGARAVLGTGQPTFRAPIEYGRPKMGGVAAYKLEETSPGQWRLNPAWLSRDMDMAEEVIVANGVVFAYGSGEDTTQTLPDLAWDEPDGPWVGGGAQSLCRAAHSQLAPRDDLRARRSDRTRALVERESDHVLEPLERHDGRERARVPGDVRRHDVQLRRSRRRPGSRSGVMMRFGTTSSIVVAASPRRRPAWSGARAAATRPTGRPLTATRSTRRWVRTDVNISPETMSAAGIRAAVEDDARESGAARRVAGSQASITSGVNHLHAGLDARRSVQSDLCGRQRHRQPVLDAAFRRSARRGDCGVSRRDLRGADADGEPHRPPAARSSEAVAGAAGVLQQRGRRAGRRRAACPAPRRRPRSAARRRRRHLRPPAPAPAARASPSTGSRQRSRPANRRSVTVPDGNAAAQGSGGGLFRPSGVVYAVSADGMFRTLGAGLRQGRAAAGAVSSRRARASPI